MSSFKNKIKKTVKEANRCEATPDMAKTFRENFPDMDLEFHYIPKTDSYEVHFSKEGKKISILEYNGESFDICNIKGEKMDG